MPALNGENNVLLTNDIICAEALRLLVNNLVYGKLASKRYESEFADVGQTVNIQLPARTKSASGRVLTVQPMVKKTVPLTISNQQNVGVQWTMKDKTLSIGSFSDQFLKSAVAQIANVVDASIGATVLNSSFYSNGTPGTAITENSLIDGKASAILTGMPDDGLLSVVLDPRDGAAITKSIKTLFQPDMVKTAVEKGWIGPIADISVYQSANVAYHTVGALGGTPLVNGASQSGSSLVTNGWTAAAAQRINAGDVFTIAGVNAVNPQTYASTGQLMQFVATANGSSDASGNMTISISPAINSGAQTTVDSLGNNVSTKAYQNVDSLPASGAAITVVGTANTRYRYAPIFHRDAIAFAAPPLRKPDTAVVAEVMTDEQTGISIAMTGGYDVTNHIETYRLDVIWGVAAVYPELIQRVISAVG